MLWLAAQFPMLGFEVRPLDAEQADRPKVLVQDGRVAQADERALDAGIAVGSKLATACSIAPGLLHFALDVEAEQKRLHRLARATYRYSSLVSLAPPDALLLEARASLRLFHGLTALKERLAALYSGLGHESRMATAATPLAAQALARAGFPDGAGGALDAVPIACADLSPQTLERLENIGVFRLGELRELPVRELGKRFERELTDYLARLAGRKADPRRAILPPERFASSVHLLDPIRGKEALLFPMRRLATELERWLALRGLGATALRWTFAPAGGATASLEVRLAEPRADAASFLALSRLQLDKAHLPEEVMSVYLRARRTLPMSSAAADLLALAESDARAASRAELVDRLTAKLGEDALASLALADDHRPERAWRRREPMAASTRRPSPVDGAERPLWLLDPPRPVRVDAFDLRTGPERIDGAWWSERGEEGEAQPREYFTALAESGAWCWLYRQGNPPSWYLHGHFA